MQESYIAIDLETTGLNPKQDRILEIGAIRVQDGIETGQYHTLVDPHCEISERVVELTGITGELVEGAPDIGDIIAEVREFCGELPLLGHNIMFDFSFLKQAAVNQGIGWETWGIDTLKLCRKFMPEEEKKNLQAACRFFDMEQEQAHRALGDARDAHRLYQILKQRFGAASSEAFEGYALHYKVKRAQPASKKQKEDLRYLVKYHKIKLPVQIDSLSRSEASRLKDQIISQYGRICPADASGHRGIV